MAITAAYSIGFAGHSAEEFFTALRVHGIRRLIDVRLRPTSQLAGFAKARDLSWFLAELCRAEYIHEPLLAPTAELLDGYRKKQIPWEEYEERFAKLMQERSIETALSPSLIDVPAVLLCSEHTPDRCHRRLVLEHLAPHWGGFEIVHL